jgi:hypothetical protein
MRMGSSPPESPPGCRRRLGRPVIRGWRGSHSSRLRLVTSSGAVLPTAPLDVIMSYSAGRDTERRQAHVFGDEEIVRRMVRLRTSGASERRLT